MGKFTRLLNSLPSGPKGHLGDFQHAARIFVDGNYRLSPRTKFLYYVYFEIDGAAHQSATFSQTRSDKEMSLLAKRCDLPKIKLDSVTKNQYNRKKIVYTNSSYEPVTFSFHDDTQGIMHAFYSLYYGYYVKDHANKTFDYSLGNRFPLSNAKYGMDNNVQVNLIKRISIFTMSQHRFSEYKLFGPRITQWQHGDVDYALGGETIENTMTVEYEGVSYNEGSVSYGVPDGFASLSYDKQPSPLTLAGGGLRGIAGALGGDVYEGMNSAMGGDLSIKNILKKPGTFIGAAIQSVNAYSKHNEGAAVGLPGIVGAFGTPAAQAGVGNVIGGVISAQFPQDPGVGELINTVAVPKIVNAINEPSFGSFGSAFGGNGGRAPTASVLSGTLDTTQNLSNSQFFSLNNNNQSATTFPVNP